MVGGEIIHGVRTSGFGLSSQSGERRTIFLWVRARGANGFQNKTKVTHVKATLCFEMIV